MQKIRTALHTIRLDCKNTVDDEDEDTDFEKNKRSEYLHLARAVDEYVADVIYFKAKAGASLPAIANHLGIEQETVIHMASANVEGKYQGKDQHRLSRGEKEERNSIIIDLYNKGFRQVDISKKMEINTCVVNGVVHRYLKSKKK